VRSPEGAKRFVWGQLLVKCVRIRHFGVSEDRRLRLLSRDPRNRETRYKYGERAPSTISANRYFGVRQLESRETRKEKSRSRELRQRAARSSGSRHFGCRDTKEASLGVRSREVRS
jgi:hypothetical protein